MRMFFIFTGVWLLCNVILVSAEYQSESATHIHVFLFFGFPSRLGHHRALSRVPCAILLVLISHMFYTSVQFSSSVVSDSFLSRV